MDHQFHHHIPQPDGNIRQGDGDHDDLGDGMGSDPGGEGSGDEDVVQVDQPRAEKAHGHKGDDTANDEQVARLGQGQGDGRQHGKYTDETIVQGSKMKSLGPFHVGIHVIRLHTGEAVCTLQPGVA